MLHRFLVLIFAFNIIMPSAFAAGTMSGCDMDSMKESSSLMGSMASSSMIDTMSDMSCSMDDGTPCSVLECIGSCSASIVPQLLSENSHPLVLVAGRHKPDTGFAYFYKIVHPIHTPPPLV
jgi:hypothetical protein